MNKDHLAQGVSEDQKAVRVSRESLPLAPVPPQKERKEPQGVMADKGYKGHQDYLDPEESLVFGEEMEKR